MPIATRRTVASMLARIRNAVAGAALVLLAPGCAAPATTAVSSAPTSMVMPPPSSGPATSSAAGRLVDPATFAGVIGHPGTVTIDVHIPFEGKIAGTDLMIPYNEIDRQAAQLPADHTTELAIYCRSGNMSAIAAKTLASMGYTDVVELRGGMEAWRAAGRTLLSTQ